ncbi:MAG: hypothetical protein MZV70_03595, partial [Desulfobacterales bacterium]|nr:hypothetical protein [Desulfobacterales bacterium]
VIGECSGGAYVRQEVQHLGLVHGWRDGQHRPHHLRPGDCRLGYGQVFLHRRQDDPGQPSVLGQPDHRQGRVLGRYAEVRHRRP